MNITKIPVIKTVLYKSPIYDIVMIFTALRDPLGDYIQIQINCPKDGGEKWIYNHLKTIHYEIVYEGFEVVAPG
jgi:hypothetical protein